MLKMTDLTENAILLEEIKFQRERYKELHQSANALAEEVASLRERLSRASADYHVCRVTLEWIAQGYAYGGDITREEMQAMAEKALSQTPKQQA